MSTFKNKNNLRTIEAQIVQKLKNNEARPKFTGSYKKKSVQTKNNPYWKYAYLPPITATNLVSSKSGPPNFSSTAASGHAFLWWIVWNVRRLIVFVRLTVNVKCRDHSVFFRVVT